MEKKIKESRFFSRSWIASVDAMEKKIKESQIVMLPGGFSGGDEPDGSGKFIVSFLRNPRLTDAIHDQKSSCKADKQAQTKERFLRYPQFVCSCLVLICTKKYERQKAHCGKIYYNVFQHIFVLI